MIHRAGTRRFGVDLRSIFVATVGAVLFVSSSASAVQLGFDCISNNFAPDCATGEAQLFVDVTDPGGGQVLFTFSNIGPDSSSITDVYFDDGTLLGIASVVNDPGFVEFMVPATPSELPSANSIFPPFETTAGFSADSDPAVPINGVNPGEELGIFFDLQSGGTFGDVLAELANGDLRIGLHIQDYALGGSESFVNVPLPEPSAALLLGEGMLLLGLLRTARRRS